MSNILTATQAPAFFPSSASIRDGNHTRLELTAEHDPIERTLLFTLDRRLPGHFIGSYFMYGGQVIEEDATIEDPKVALCESPRVRSFLMGLAYQSHLEVLSFGLMEVKVRYAALASPQKVFDIFAKACAKSLEINDESLVIV